MLKKIVCFVLAIVVTSSSAFASPTKKVRSQETPAPFAYASAQDAAKYKDYGIEIVENNEYFTQELRLSYSLYSTVSDVCSHINNCTQNHNPEVLLDVAAQELTAHFYMTYYGDCSKEEAREVVEEYTDVLLEVLSATYPLLTIEVLDINWSIPAVNPNSLYAARFWCENRSGVIERGDGTGDIYN